MYYEILVTKNDKHYFATADRSLRCPVEAQKLYNHFKLLFPLSEGYAISVSYSEKRSKGVHFDAVTTEHPDQGKPCHEFTSVSPNKAKVMYYVIPYGGVYRKMERTPWEDVTLQTNTEFYSQLAENKAYRISEAFVDFGAK